MKLSIMLIVLSMLVGCGEQLSTTAGSHSNPIPNSKDVIIHAVATVDLTSVQSVSGRSAITGATSQATSTIGMSVVNNNSSIMTLGSWTNPIAQTATDSTTKIDFGNVTIATLFDNNLNVCNSNPSPHKCNTAGFAAFMVTNAGLVNGTDSSQIMPIDVSSPITVLTALSTTSPGLFLYSYTIAGNKNNVKLADFGAASNYTFDVQGDFSNVGSGTYTGTMTIVFFLAN
jgi:hypothetical protein